MSGKNFILDTNVLLHDPKALFGFEDNTVIVPIVVIEEVDTFKRDQSELGRNAREVSRTIDRLRTLGNLTDGIPLSNGGRLRVVLTNRELPRGYRISHQADNRIMATALYIKESEPDRPTIFVTLDTNLRIRANALGIVAEDYDAERLSFDQLYPDTSEIDAPEGTVARLFKDGWITFDELPQTGPHHENEYAMVRDGRGSALVRLRLGENRAELIRKFRDAVCGIKPRNREQHFALDACLQSDVKLVALVGKAGTGKTLLALAAGLQSVMDEGSFHRVLVSRPIQPLGRDIGYLPGEIEKKLKPWMQPIHDNVEFLLGRKGRERRRGAVGVPDLVGKGVLEVEPLTYIRGRSIPNQYMIVDEAQNLTPHEIKTILTRAGDETKVVFTGDPYQIDNPYVDSVTNGLTHLVDRFRNETIAASVYLVKGERSALAEAAANLL